MSLAFPNTVLNTIVAEAIDEMCDELEAKVNGSDVAEAVTAVVKDTYTANKAVCFSGDNYDEAWHAEAEQRGLKNLRTTPEALPEVLSDTSVQTMEKYEVLSERELESRFEVWAEQYALSANIEGEVTASIARTMILPAALRHLAVVEAAGVDGLGTELRELIEEFTAAVKELEAANRHPDETEGIDLAIYSRDNQLTAMDRVRVAGDKLEKVVADDLWPLPKYSEMLFIK
jgi:glutamine synthetase